MRETLVLSSQPAAPEPDNIGLYLFRGLGVFKGLGVLWFRDYLRV